MVNRTLEAQSSREVMCIQDSGEELSGRVGVNSSIIIAAASYTSYRLFNPLESRQSVWRPWQIIIQRSGRPATRSRE